MRQRTYYAFIVFIFIRTITSYAYFTIITPQIFQRNMARFTKNRNQRCTRTIGLPEIFKERRPERST